MFVEVEGRYLRVEHITHAGPLEVRPGEKLPKSLEGMCSYVGLTSGVIVYFALPVAELIEAIQAQTSPGSETSDEEVL